MASSQPEFRRGDDRQTNSASARLWSIPVWEEKGKECVATVPSHWVNEVEKLVFWPPKRINSGHALSKWMEPTEEWVTFPLIKMKLAESCKEVCDHYVHWESSGAETDATLQEKCRSPPKCEKVKKRKGTPSPPRPSKRWTPGYDFEISPSPTPTKRRLSPSPPPSKRSPQSPPRPKRSSMSPPPSKRVTPSEILRQLSPIKIKGGDILTKCGMTLSEPACSTPRRSPRRSNKEPKKSYLTEVTNHNVGVRSIPNKEAKKSLTEVPNSNVGGSRKDPAKSTKSDGGANFTEMSNKRFQYSMLMALAKQEEEMKKLRLEVAQLGRRVEPEASIFHLKTMDSMEQFNNFEEELSNDGMRLCVSRLVLVGGHDLKDAVKNVMHLCMTKNLLTQFNKFGGGNKKKRAFMKTKLYVCVRDSLLQSVENATINDINRDVGNLLRRIVM